MYTFYRYSAHSLVRSSIKNSTSGQSWKALAEAVRIISSTLKYRYQKCILLPVQSSDIRAVIDTFCYRYELNGEYSGSITWHRSGSSSGLRSKIIHYKIILDVSTMYIFAFLFHIQNNLDYINYSVCIVK
jgi:hypothetical protein